MNANEENKRSANELKDEELKEVFQDSTRHMPHVQI